MDFNHQNAVIPNSQSQQSQSQSQSQSQLQQQQPQQQQQRQSSRPLAFPPVRYLPPLGPYVDPANGNMETQLPKFMEARENHKASCGRCFKPKSKHPGPEKNFWTCTDRCGICGETHPIAAICHHLYASTLWLKKRMRLRSEADLPANMQVRPSQGEEQHLQSIGYIRQGAVHTPGELPQFTDAAWALRDSVPAASVPSAGLFIRSNERDRDGHLTDRPQRGLATQGSSSASTVPFNAPARSNATMSPPAAAPQRSTGFGTPVPAFAQPPASSYGTPAPAFAQFPASSYAAPAPAFGQPPVAYGAPAPAFAQPPVFQPFPVVPMYNPYPFPGSYGAHAQPHHHTGGYPVALPQQPAYPPPMQNVDRARSPEGQSPDRRGRHERSRSPDRQRRRDSRSRDQSRRNGGHSAGHMTRAERLDSFLARVTRDPPHTADPPAENKSQRRRR